MKGMLKTTEERAQGVVSGMALCLSSSSSNIRQ
jgi:hypothetical protein